MLKDIKTIIWDWNGTLLNDVDACVESINVLLKARQLPLMNRLRYKTLFGFPVQCYYEEIGFDFTREPYDVVAFEFMDEYLSRLSDLQLHSDVIPVLNYFKLNQYTQAVLSAMEQETLNRSLAEKGITSFFSVIMGIQDHFAEGKIENGKKIIRELNIAPENALLIGDTIHDHEVASEIGCKCILVADGHQAPERLRKTGRTVVEDLFELIGRPLG
jgi:phosphoglycolate phosphatase